MRILILLFLTLEILSGQVLIKGKVLDADTGDPLAGATVFSQEAGIGGYTNAQGEFSLSYTGNFPVTFTITYFGYDTVKTVLKEPPRNWIVKMAPQSVQQEEVVITDTRISEKIYESPMTVEQMDLKSIELNPSADFYEGLGQLKGVDVIFSSLGFKSINMRGFNSTRPIRVLQLIDGMDNQSPGLSFSVGNFTGAPELDIQSVSLFVGAQGSKFGPNAFNGTILMTTKDPFIHQGLTVSTKVGERQLVNMAMRFAKAFTDKFAMKTTMEFMRAYDWEATNVDSTPQSLRGLNNPGGYDAVNRYGDENVNPLSNNFSDSYGRRFYPGLGIFYRTGYNEKDVADYNMYNVKLNHAFHYKFTEKLRLIASYNMGTGTTIFQGDNRYALKDIILQQTKLELNHPNFYVRAYSTWEDAGKSYDLVFTSILLQNAVLSDRDWSSNYINYWGREYAPRIRAIVSSLGYNPYDPASLPIVDSVVASLQDSLIIWHQRTRAYADGQIDTLVPARLEPGSPEFIQKLQEITSKKTFLEGGSRFYDKSALYHIQGEYRFNPEFAQIIVGGNYRLYTPRSDGTIFSDTLIDPNRPELGYKKIRVYEYGVFVTTQKKLINERLTLDASIRMDKNQNFNYLFSPAVSFVYKVRERQNLRMAFSSALRNPTLHDQYLYYNVGRAILIGNLNGADTLVSLESLYDYIETYNPDTLDFLKINPISPEKARSLEIGYKGFFGKRLYVDFGYYMTLYRDFIGFLLVSTDPGTYSNPKPIQIYRISANAKDPVLTQGLALGTNIYLGKFYEITFNWSWNELDKNGGWVNDAIKGVNKMFGKEIIKELQAADDPIIPAFNTPRNKFNIGFNGRNITTTIGNFSIEKWGFGINYKWVQGYWYEGSPQFTGYVPGFDIIDAQINKSIEKWNAVIKIGASNLLNKRYFQAFGAPYLGRLAYVQLTVNVK